MRALELQLFPGQRSISDITGPDDSLIGVHYAGGRFFVLDELGEVHCPDVEVSQGLEHPDSFQDNEFWLRRLIMDDLLRYLLLPSLQASKRDCAAQALARLRLSDPE